MPYEVDEAVSIAKERCIAAFKAQPVAKYAWCCHHTELVETLYTSPFVRIDYIMDCKPAVEQVTRLNNFRPVTDDAAIVPLAREYFSCKAKATYDIDAGWQALTVAQRHERAKLVETNATVDELDALAAKFKAERAKLCDVFMSEMRKAAKPLMPFYWKDVPLGTWDGISIFSGRGLEYKV